MDSKILFVLPTADYAAYNSWGGKYLYYDRVGGGTVQASGTGRAVKVSFDRPMFDGNEDRDRIFGPESETIFWLEKQGYDVSYSDDVAVSQNPASLKDHDIVIVPGHSEYWSEEEFKGFKAAREAGVDIASFSANTAYWKVRYENGSRTLVCYKTVQGDGSNASGATSDNDWGPDGIKGTADDALGLDGEAGTADDKPQNSTTTWRDNGAPKGDPNAPPGGRVGPDMPENSLWGVMYFGDNAALELPAEHPRGQRQRRILLRPDLAQHRDLGEQNDDDRRRTRRLGVGLGPDPGAVPRPAAGRGKEAHLDQRRRARRL